jgi:hypothetical protein
LASYHAAQCPSVSAPYILVVHFWPVSAIVIARSDAEGAAWAIQGIAPLTNIKENTALPSLAMRPDHRIADRISRTDAA